MSEARIQAEIMIALGCRPDIRIWRNSTGCLPAASGRMVKFGLVGSADILGIMKPSGRFLAIEVKSPKGRQSEHQKNFQRMIEDHGGLYILARSPEQAIEALEREE